MEDLDGKFVVRALLGETGTPFYATTPDHGSFLPMYFSEGEERCKRVFKKLLLFGSKEEAVTFIENQQKSPTLVVHSLEAHPATRLWQKIEVIIPHGVNTQIGR